MNILKYIKLLLFNKIKNESKKSLNFKSFNLKNNIFKVEGKDNKIDIEKYSKIKNSKIFLKGNNIKLKIEKNVKILDSFIEI